MARSADGRRARWARALCAAVALAAAGRATAQIEEGKVGKYLEYDEAAGVRPDYPALTIDDLRKVTLYSKLAIRGSQVVIADAAYLRGIEAHPRDKDLLIVTSDHFRFTVLKNAAIDPREGPGYKFLWIQHATKETLDGKPWLKDLVLLPYQKKTGKLLSPWPFKGRKSANPDRDVPFRDARFSIAAGDPRPARLKAPPEAQCVVGTFHSGNADYLVLDVFGGYSWWGKVASQELLPLRGAAPAAIDAFHKAAGARKAGPPFVESPWRNPRSKNTHSVLATTADGAKRLAAKLPAILETKVRSEVAEGWEDLLLLDEENLPIKALDDLLKDAKTFGDIVAWAGTYSENRWDSGLFHTEWFGPLEEDLKESERSHIVNARVLRYAFRRMGFPAQVHGVHEKIALYPHLLLEVFIPSQRVSWFFISNHRTHVICEPESPVLYALPNMTFTFRGKLPLFDIHLGGGKLLGMPAARG
ncbi:MAG: hypothetical protein HY721_06380 [Planctomycetes bacterium]|nr:hypothetical protein [Planctomycetota bacterium]